MPYTELTRNDLKWKAMDSTCVETQSFYLNSDNGVIGLAQVIYSNVAYVKRLHLLCMFWKLQSYLGLTHSAAFLD